MQQRQKPRRENGFSCENCMECSLSYGWARANCTIINALARLKMGVFDFSGHVCFWPIVLQKSAAPRPIAQSGQY